MTKPTPTADLFRKYEEATNPVTRSSYRQAIINRIERAGIALEEINPVTGCKCNWSQYMLGDGCDVPEQEYRNEHTKKMAQMHDARTRQIKLIAFCGLILAIAFLGIVGYSAAHFLIKHW